MKTSCGKCGAGPGNIEQRTVYLASERKIEQRCMLCGWMNFTRTEARQYARKNKKVKEIRLADRVVNYHKPQVEHRPCTRVGCTGTYGVVARTKYKLCPDCSVRMQNWIRRGMKTPPPFIQQDNQWVDNPEFGRKRRVA